VPIEIFEAADAASACRWLAAGADLAYLDGALPAAEIAPIIAAAKAASKPPFTVLLAADAAAQPFATDGLSDKPSRAEEARSFLQRSIRVRLPSRVLVVDDSGTMRSIVRKTLAATRFPLDVSEANEGSAAVKLVREAEFDIVFLDFNMPGLSGLESLSAFKREKHPVHVVMMTSTQDELLAGRAQAEGAAFLKKPFFPADIEAVLCRFYGLRELNPKRA
jgi:CheY-like chemotaxis protein